ncbi:unnamed protein product [Discula destructiva]
MDGIARPYSADDCVDDSTPVVASSALSLPSLPSELIDHILAYLAPLDLATVCLVNHTLRAHALADHLWQGLVQSNVPGVKVTSPAPCASFRELYIAHDPHWFLTKYKIWFCDKDLTGKLILARYDQTRGVVEGYQLLANSTKKSSTTNSNLMDNVVLEVHEFNPEVKLHLEKPVMQLRANSLEKLMRAAKTKLAPPVSNSTTSTKGLTGIAARWVNTFGSASSSTTTTAPPQPSSSANAQVQNRFSEETPMSLDGRASDTMFSAFMLAKAMSTEAVEERKYADFPYGNMWPPPAIPTAERVSAAHYMSGNRMLDHSKANGVAPEDRPLKRSEISDKAFRIRSWLARPTSSSSAWASPLNGWPFQENASLFGQSTQQWLPSYSPGSLSPTPSSSAHIWDSVTTYSTLDPVDYTPTAEQPWKGIWVGDYSGHGCEFLLMKQHHATPFDAAAFDATRTEDETDAEFAARRADARKYRGSLEAIKLTGDPNVPRGECTFRAADLGEEGYETTIEAPPFAGARVVRSQGHVAMTGFTHDRYIPSQLLLISENRLAQYWVGYNHVSFFERVDIDQFLVPN